MNKLLVYCLIFAAFTTCKAQSGADAGAMAGQDQAQSTVPAEPVNISAAAFQAKSNDPNVVILDVRTPEEVAGGMIDGAIHLDYRAPDFERQVAELDKEKTYLVYCASGGRSGRTCELMEDNGFEKFHNLAGGYGAYIQWKAAQR